MLEYGTALVLGSCLCAAAAGEVLYNGIKLPDEWPPRIDTLTPEPLPTPTYLVSPPKVIPIDVGRQLFVDDFLIAETDLVREYHLARYFIANPVLKPDRPWEMEGGSPCAMPFSDGVFWDPHEKLFKMWYMGGYCTATCYATSKDGITWDKPELDVVPGTNIVWRGHRDSTTVWPDWDEPDPEKRYKMLCFRDDDGWKLSLYFSPDGIHWSEPVDGPSWGDRSSFFYNPFRGKWVFSLRAGTNPMGRCRRYFEATDPLAWSLLTEDPTLWVGADSLDPRRPEVGTQPQLYNLDCVAYESVMLGLFSIWYGQPQDRPKPNAICLGYSRDGFQWSRPDRRPFIPVSETRGDWNWGNVQSAGGCCLVVEDELWFYVSGRQGVEGSSGSGLCSTGLAVIRRDGFASMNSGAFREGTLTTRPVRFSGKYLFINADASHGAISAEVLDESGRAITPYTRENCLLTRVDTVSAPVRWQAAEDLSPFVGKPVRFRFHVRNAKLYAFWVSKDLTGESSGYPAAGEVDLGGA